MSDDDPEFLKCPCKECGNNIEFPASSARDTIACPHCGQWTELIVLEEPEASGKTTVNLSLVFSIAVPVLLLAVIGGVIFHAHHQPPPADGHPSQPAASAKTEPTPAPTPLAVPTNPVTPIVTNPVVVPAVVEHRPKSLADLKAGEVTLEKTEGNSLVYAVGEIKNDSEYQRFSVRIELDLISLKGAKIGTAEDYKAIIEPYQTWRFHALIPEPKAVAARLASIKEE